MRKKSMTYTIGAVAETYGLHQQTLRLYEREGLLTPSRSKGNTRLYTDEDLVRLETILSLTRDLGVNLAGVGIILDMLQRMDQMQRDFESVLAELRDRMSAELGQSDDRARLALVPRRAIPFITARRPADE